ncbi:hypothetical protein [Streptomyces sp. enrichment culture]|uniref:hypothetical protein n=1 Tax=Streptomyces sp. enrichment culture TaxID=1795815 RepID=UPI003F542A5E
MLNLKAGKSAVTFEYTDDNMTASWTVKADDGEAKLLSTMRFVIAFVESQNGHEPLPERIPGMALGMAQTAHPAPPETPVNGWAAGALPEIPEHAKGEWELNTPEGEG